LDTALHVKQYVNLSCALTLYSVFLKEFESAVGHTPYLGQIPYGTMMGSMVHLIATVVSMN
jgi:hypothetical protein